MPEELQIPDPEWLRDLSRATRARRAEEGAVGTGTDPRGLMRQGDLIVVITGSAVPIATGAELMVYPGIALERNVDALVTADKYSYLSQCFVEELSGDTLTVGGRYKGMVVGMYQGEPLIEVAKGGGTGGSGVELIRITNYFIQDTNPPKDPPSTDCFYPGVLVVRNVKDNFPDVSPEQKVWWKTPFPYASWAQLSPDAPFTVVRADGQGFVDGVYTGGSYAPDDSNNEVPHPQSGQLRPVYSMARFDGAIGVTCQSIDGRPRIVALMG